MLKVEVSTASKHSGGGEPHFVEGGGGGDRWRRSYRCSYLGEEGGEDLLMAAHVNASVQSLHLLLVLRQRVLERITLDVQLLVLCLPGDRDVTD